LSLQEQRIRASHNIKQLSNKVADRITKGLKRGRNSRGGTVEAAAAAAAAEGDNSGSSSGGEGQEGAGASRTELADMIRKNGEEIATSVEMVVEKVSWGYSSSSLHVFLAGSLCMKQQVYPGVTCRADEQHS
jgi:hypothetical protein